MHIHVCVYITLLIYLQRRKNRAADGLTARGGASGPGAAETKAGGEKLLISSCVPDTVTPLPLQATQANENLYEATFCDCVQMSSIIYHICCFVVFF